MCNTIAYSALRLTAMCGACGRTENIRNKQLPTRVRPNTSWADAPQLWCIGQKPRQNRQASRLNPDYSSLEACSFFEFASAPRIITGLVDSCVH